MKLRRILPINENSDLVSVLWMTCSSLILLFMRQHAATVPKKGVFFVASVGIRLDVNRWLQHVTAAP